MCQLPAEAGGGAPQADIGTMLQRLFPGLAARRRPQMPGVTRGQVPGGTVTPGAPPVTAGPPPPAPAEPGPAAGPVAPAPAAWWNAIPNFTHQEYENIPNAFRGNLEAAQGWARQTMANVPGYRGHFSPLGAGVMEKLAAYKPPAAAPVEAVTSPPGGEAPGATMAGGISQAPRVRPFGPPNPWRRRRFGPTIGPAGEGGPLE